MKSGLSPMLAWRHACVALLLCELTACGRFGFSPQATSEGPGDDAAVSTRADSGLSPDAAVPPDAGPGDASTSMADGAATPGDGGAMRACAGAPSDVFWCANFNDDYPAASSIDRSQGSLARVGTPTLDGLSLRASTERASGRAALVSDLTEFPGTTVYLRGHVFVASSEVLSDLTLFHLGPWTDGLGGTDIDLSGNRLEAYFYADGSLAKSRIAVPRDRWFCLQVRLDAAETGGAVSISLDGTQIVDSSGVRTASSAGLSEFAVGVPWTGLNQPAVNVYFDEIAIGPTLIPCL